MSIATVISLCYVAVLMLAVWALSRLGRARRTAPSPHLLPVWDSATQGWVYLPPGALLDVGQLTAAEVAEVEALEAQLALPDYDRAWDAGCERLWDAIRDEQNQGDQT